MCKLLSSFCLFSVNDSLVNDSTVEGVRLSITLDILISLLFVCLIFAYFNVWFLFVCLFVFVFVSFKHNKEIVV